MWRIWWTCGSIDVADTVLFRLRYGLITLGSTLIEAAITGVLNTAIPTDTVPAATAFTINATGYGALNGDTVVPDNTVSGGAGLFLEVAMVTKDPDMAEALFFVGLEVGYLPRLGNDANAFNVNARRNNFFPRYHSSPQNLASNRFTG